LTDKRFWFRIGWFEEDTMRQDPEPLDLHDCIMTEARLCPICNSVVSFLLVELRPGTDALTTYLSVVASREQGFAFLKFYKSQAPHRLSQEEYNRFGLFLATANLPEKISIENGMAACSRHLPHLKEANTRQPAPLTSISSSRLH